MCFKSIKEGEPLEEGYRSLLQDDSENDLRTLVGLYLQAVADSRGSTAVIPYLHLVHLVVELCLKCYIQGKGDKAKKIHDLRILYNKASNLGDDLLDYESFINDISDISNDGLFLRYPVEGVNTGAKLKEVAVNTDKVYMKLDSLVRQVLGIHSYIAGLQSSGFDRKIGVTWYNLDARSLSEEAAIIYVAYNLLSEPRVYNNIMDITSDAWKTFLGICGCLSVSGGCYRISGGYKQDIISFEYRVGEYNSERTEYTAGKIGFKTIWGVTEDYLYRVLTMGKSVISRMKEGK